MLLKKIAYALALGCLVSAANAAPLFTVQESAITGAVANEVEADKLTLRYEAAIDQTAGGTFTETGYFNVTAYALGNDTVSSQLNGLEATGGYRLYGTFTVSGTIAVVGTTLLATFTSGNVFITADPGQNTTKSIAGGAVVIGGTTADDIPLASSTKIVQLSQANVPLVGGQAASGGSFVITYDLLALTAAGVNFFVDPVPFYLRMEVTGENESFTPALTAGAYQGIAQGDASATFALPEPGTVALLGLGLLGILGVGGAVRRRAS